MAADEHTRVIDEKGRITIPNSIRERLHLTPGESVEIELEDDRIVIRPQISREEFIRTMRGCVTAETRQEAAPSLTPEDLKADWTSDLGPGQ